MTRRVFAPAHLTGAAVLAAVAAVAWSLYAAAAHVTRIAATTVPDRVGDSAAAYGATAALVAAGLTGRAAARRVRYRRGERAAAAAHWAAVQAGLDQVLIDVRARPDRPARPALPRPLGMTVHTGGSR